MPGVLLGIPLGIGLYKFAERRRRGMTTIPPAWWLAAAVLAILAHGGRCWPASPPWPGTRRSSAEVLQAETA